MGAVTYFIEVATQFWAISMAQAFIPISVSIVVIVEYNQVLSKLYIFEDPKHLMVESSSWIKR